MVDQGKEGGLRARYSHAETVSNRSSEGQDGAVDQQPFDTPDQTTGHRTKNGLSDQTRNRIATQLRAMASKSEAQLLRYFKLERRHSLANMHAFRADGSLEKVRGLRCAPFQSRNSGSVRCAKPPIF